MITKNSFIKENILYVFDLKENLYIKDPLYIRDILYIYIWSFIYKGLANDILYKGKENESIAHKNEPWLKKNEPMAQKNEPMTQKMSHWQKMS